MRAFNSYFHRPLYLNNSNTIQEYCKESGSKWNQCRYNENMYIPLLKAQTRRLQLVDNSAGMGSESRPWHAIARNPVNHLGRVAHGHKLICKGLKGNALLLLRKNR